MSFEDEFDDDLNGIDCSDACDAANEALSSQINNFVNSFYGPFTKVCVNNQVVWQEPCNLTSGSAFFPRLPNEGIACYFLRWINSTSTNTGIVPGLKGYNSRALTNLNVILFRFIDFLNQDFTGTLSGPVTIFLTANGAQAGDEFYLSFTNLVITAVNNISINSDGTNLLVINTPGTLKGCLKAVYTGTVWKLTLTTINIS